MIDMKHYRVLDDQHLMLSPKETKDLKVSKQSILIPLSDSKVFLHWKNSQGKLLATCTLTTPTLVSNTLQLINGTEESVEIQVIEL